MSSVSLASRPGYKNGPSSATTRENPVLEVAEDGPDAPPPEPQYSQERSSEVGLYVRVISDRIMSLSRKAWARYRAEIQQAAHQA